MKKQIIEETRCGIKAGDMVVPKKCCFVPGISVAARVEKVVLTTDETGPSCGRQSEWLELEVGKDRRLIEPSKFERIQCN